ncbi:MAG: hypothetical protein RLZZ198_519 [Bacteroidota bacterium]|jgi:hypothetical protein
MKSVVERIKVLVELRDSGSITNEEFDRMLELLEAEIDKEKLDSASENKTRNNKTLFQFTKKQVTGLTFSFLCLVILSYFTMIPAFIWDSDGDGFHNYRNDNCPAVSGTCQGCLDSDNDGFVDSEDECPKESSTTFKGCPDSDNDGVADKADTCVNQPGSLNCSGCPDRDGDGVRDSLDQCPEVKGLKIFHGCSKERMLELERIKLVQGLAIKAPPSCKSTAGEHWIRFVNGYYEFSEFETKGFRDVKSNQTVQELNAYFDLKGTLKPKPQKPKIPKPDPFISRKGLTQMEESELKELRLKELNGVLLTSSERRRKSILEMKRHKYVN